MKKIILLLSVVALILYSCNTDDTTTPVAPVNTANILVKKIVTTSVDDPDSNGTSIFTYSGLKLAGIQVVGVGKSLFYYTGDLITKIEAFEGTSVVERELFTYNSNGKLIEYRDQSLVDNLEHKYLYVYNSDGSVSYTDNFGIINNTNPNSSGVNIYTNNELSSRSFSNQTDSYVYDNKNSPFKNITGLSNLLTLREFADDYLVFFGKDKNVIKVTDNSDQTIGVFCTYTYNSNNFPSAATKRINFPPIQSTTLNVEYFY